MMPNRYKLLKFDFTKLDDQRTAYQFILKNKSNWQEEQQIVAKLKNEDRINQDNLSDFEYYLKIYGNPDNLEEEIYYFLVEDIPVAKGLVKPSIYGLELAIETVPSERRKGYGEIFLQMLIEQIEINNNSSKIILHISEFNQTAINLAKKQGFIYQTADIWLKVPAIKEDQDARNS